MTSLVLRNYSDFGHSRFLPVQCLQSYLLYTRAIRHGKSQSSSLRLKNVKKNEHNEDQTVDNVVVKSSPPLPISPNPPLQKSKLQNQSLNQLQWQLKHISRTRNRESLTLTQEDYPVPQIGTVILRNGTSLHDSNVKCSNVLFRVKSSTATRRRTRADSSDSDPETTPLCTKEMNEIEKVGLF